MIKLFFSFLEMTDFSFEVRITLKGKYISQQIVFLFA